MIIQFCQQLLQVADRNVTYGTLYHSAYVDSNITYGTMFIVQHTQNPLWWSVHFTFLRQCCSVCPNIYTTHQNILVFTLQTVLVFCNLTDGSYLLFYSFSLTKRSTYLW